jgi:hypothetical protein
MATTNRTKREAWRQAREVASAPPYQVRERADGWVVEVDDERWAGPFATNSEAWRWIDRNSVARRYGAKC